MYVLWAPLILFQKINSFLKEKLGDYIYEFYIYEFNSIIINKLIIYSFLNVCV